MTTNNRQIADRQMLVRLNKTINSSSKHRNPIHAADSVLEDIWCGPKDSGQIQEGWGACACCFGYKMLFQAHCLNCSLAVV